MALSWRVGAVERATAIPWFFASACGRYTIARVAYPPADPMDRQPHYRWDAWLCRQEKPRREPELLAGNLPTAEAGRQVCVAHAAKAAKAVDSGGAS